MTETDASSEKSPLSSHWARAKAYSHRFWWLRGFFGTFALLALIPDYFMSEWEFARAVHAVLINWNDLLTIFGLWISGVLPLPALSSALLNTIVVVMAVLIPYLYSEILSVQKKIAAFGVRHADLAPFAIILPGLVAVIYITYTEFSSPSGRVSPALVPMFLAGLTILACVKLRSYRHGVILAFSCLLAIEVVYWMPVIGDPVNEWAKEVTDS